MVVDKDRFKRLVAYAGAAFVSVLLLTASYKGWIQSKPLETLGFVTGAWCVYLTVKEHIWNFPIGLANSALFLIVFLQSRLFADSMLQVLYIILGIYGWYWWLKGGTNRTRLKVKKTPLYEYAILAVLAVIATFYMHRFLVSINDSAPFLDALTTVLSLVAQYMLTRKYFENWIVWIVADIIYVYLYVDRALYLTAALYAIFILLCFFGLRAWNQSILRNKTTDDMEIIHA